MADRFDAYAARPYFSGSDPMVAGRVKLIHPSNAAIIAGLALGCWAPIALSAYLLIG
ncbi:hypothetical protein [Sphingomonas sp.]|uniref:hypothetical protein n=1 Tax=Sphingomonas sp. TaxID=28214 RepID=UPI0035C7F1B8